MQNIQFGFLLGVGTVLLADYLVYGRVPAPLADYLNKPKK